MTTTTIGAGMFVTPQVRLVERLASGGMGEVWEAEHLLLGTRVAVKLIAEQYVGSSVARARFDREARAGARLETPHVVRHFDHGVTPAGVAYIVMELLRGETLCDRLERGPLSLSETASLVRQLASALEAAHAIGVVHRDVKPENVFLCPSDEGCCAKLLDFGVAAEPAMPRASTLTEPGMIIGTPSYLSPEIVLGTREADAHADLWSLAVVAYECLAGEPPFWGHTVGAVCAAIARLDYRAPTERARGLGLEVGPAVDAFFARAFAGRPHERFANAQDFAAAFQALGAAEPVLEPAAASAEDDEEVARSSVRPSRSTLATPLFVSIDPGPAKKEQGLFGRWGALALAATIVAAGTPATAWLARQGQSVAPASSGLAAPTIDLPPVQAPPISAPPVMSAEKPAAARPAQKTPPRRKLRPSSPRPSTPARPLPPPTLADIDPSPPARPGSIPSRPDLDF